LFYSSGTIGLSWPFRQRFKRAFIMDKSNPPTAYGVFKPVGHTVIAFSATEDMEAAAATLLAQGFSADDLVRYTASEMIAQVDRDLQNASALASVGQELNLVKAYHAQAQEGCCFLVVDAPDDALEQKVDAVLEQHPARSAQRYGRFMIQELVNVTPGDAQVFESPDRGLDVDAVDEKTK